MEFIYPKEIEELLLKIKESQNLYSKMDSDYAKAIYDELTKLTIKIMELAIPTIMFKRISA